MFGWLAKKLNRQDYSPFSESGIRELLESVATSAPMQALDDIGERFEGAAELEIDAAVCSRILKRLDEAAQAPLRQICDAIFGDSLGDSISDANWHAYVKHQRSVYGGYASCLNKFLPPDKISAEERQDALVLASRAMFALVSQLAFMRVRYREAYPEFWSDACALYTRALEYGVAHEPAKLYPADSQQTTVEREYLTCLMLGIAPTGSLLPTQTLCLYLILRNMSEHYRCGDQQSAKLPYVIDPATVSGPQRVAKPQAGLRFFGFGDAYAHLDLLRKSAQSNPQPPEWVQQSRIDNDRFRALVDLLMEHWSDNPPQRRDRRERLVATIIVTHGLGRVYRMLASSRFALEGKQLNYTEHMRFDDTVFKGQQFGSVKLDEPESTSQRPLTPLDTLKKLEASSGQDMIEQWTLVDSSERGLGAVAEKHRGWLRAGMLVGFRYHDSVEWRVAIVRRVARTAQGKLGVGLKCEPESARCARLRVGDSAESDVWGGRGTGADPFTDVIVLEGEHPRLIVAAGTYAAEQTCLLRIADLKQRIRLDELTERGAHFECISYSVISTS